ncbi:helix-turn-helix transcriptional regulator [Acerihabitans sp. TG2]|nr:helix-turn-helix transcriptional regulator [Acerihabitans sp. TG2]MEA9391271.1 helix-turn-helix transcriptional regulator [Acerihabitans sp. TG2]
MDLWQLFRYTFVMRPYKHPTANEFILERVLYALSDPVRLEIVRRLGQLGEASCGELDGGRPKSSVSHHFRVLRDAGLVHTKNVGTTHINSLRRSELQGRFPGLLDAILSQSA